MKILRLLLGAIFLVFALIQLNDPDPMLWVFIYGVASGLFFISAFKPVSLQLLISVIVGSACFSLFFLPKVIDLFSVGQISEITESMKAEKDYIEETREFLGLWIMNVALLFLYWQEKTKRKLV